MSSEISMGVKRKRSTYEVVIVVLVVGLSVALAFGLFSGRNKVNKGRLLMNELSMFRSAISLYNMTNHKYPQSLEELATSTYEVDLQKRPYVEFIHRSESGNVIDPFGNPYIYEKNSGWISSTSKGYTQW